MRPKKFLALPVLLLAGLAGCATKPASTQEASRPSSTAEVTPNATREAPVSAPRPLRKVVTAYLEISDDLRVRFGEDVSLALQETLRRHGFEVRGSILANADSPASATVAPLFERARTFGDGAVLGTTIRAATYLHANSPRLVLVTSLRRTPVAAKAGQPPQLALVGFLCDTQSGDVVWRGRQDAAGETLDSAHAQRLVEDFLRSVPHPPAGATNGNGHGNGNGNGQGAVSRS